MKMKVLAFLMSISLGVTGTAFATGGDYTMIVSPARYSVLQVMFDVIQKRPSVLVSYQSDEAGEPFLHAWDGASWSELELHDLGELNFVEQTPSRVVMIGDSRLLPSSIKDSLSWLPEVVVIRQLDNASLLNEFGRIMAWKQSEWSWFASRYNLALEDEAAAIRRTSWYDQAGPIIKQDQPVYEPVPVVDEYETLNPSSTLPSPMIESEPVVEEPAVESVEELEEAVDEFDEIVDTLESRSAP